MPSRLRPAAQFLVAAICTTALFSCANPQARKAPDTDGDCCLEAGRQIADRYRVTAITTRRFTHSELWNALNPLLTSPRLSVTSIGTSIHGRPIQAISFGRGPTTVLLWSQMHGDESTATMSLADIIAWLADPAPDAIRSRLESQLRVVMVPMLNPDGAELFQRENALGVDVNRDARRLSTPEARALKAIRDSLSPMFGFNLHDQNARTLGRPGNQRVGIALLAPAASSDGAYGAVRARARLVASGIRSVLEREIPGRIARYDDAFNARAFGDHFQLWGTSTVLIESGALPDDADKQRLRRVNVIAILTALDAMATERYRTANARDYDALPVNDRSAVDVIVTGGQVVLSGQPPTRVDLAFNYEDALRGGRARLREVGDLADVIAFDTIDASGLFVHPAPAMLSEQNGKQWLRLNALATFSIRRGVDPGSVAVRLFGAESK